MQLIERCQKMCIKGLYFKLNIEKSLDKEIYKFFTMEAEKKNINKIDLLYDMMQRYKESERKIDL